MTRNGKIARLPRDIRNELNERLADGEQGKRLVEWLNGHPEVQEVLDLYFNGKKVSEQNLTEWKQGGYEEWVRHQESLEWARLAADEAEELEEEGDGVPLSDRLAALAAVALGKVIRKATEAPDAPPERRALLEAVRELTALRVSDHRAARLKMDLERWREEQAGMKEKRQHRDLWEPIRFLNMVQNRESYVDLVSAAMTPEQEASLREFLNMGPRRKPRPTTKAGEGSAVPAATHNPGESG